MLRVICFQADNHQETIVLSEVKKLDTDGLVNFISTNEVRYITEYNQVVRRSQLMSSSQSSSSAYH